MMRRSLTLCSVFNVAGSQQPMASPSSRAKMQQTTTPRHLHQQSSSSQQGGGSGEGAPLWKSLGMEKEQLDQFTGFAKSNNDSFFPSALLDRQMREAAKLNIEVRKALSQTKNVLKLTTLIDREKAGAAGAATSANSNTNVLAGNKIKFSADELIIATSAAGRTDPSRREVHMPKCPVRANMMSLEEYVANIPVTATAAAINVDGTPVTAEKTCTFCLKRRMHHLACAHFSLAQSWSSLSAEPTTASFQSASLAEQLKQCPALMEAITSSSAFQSVDNFLLELKDHALHRLASGFTWVVWNPNPTTAPGAAPLEVVAGAPAASSHTTSSNDDEQPPSGKLEILNTPGGLTPLELGLWPVACINMTTSSYLTGERDWHALASENLKKQQVVLEEQTTVPAWSRAARNPLFAKQYLQATKVESPSMQPWALQKERYVLGVLRHLNVVAMDSALRQAQSWYSSAEYHAAKKKREEVLNEAASREVTDQMKPSSSKVAEMEDSDISLDEDLLSATEGNSTAEAAEKEEEEEDDAESSPLSLDAEGKLTEEYSQQQALKYPDDEDENSAPPTMDSESASSPPTSPASIQAEDPPAVAVAVAEGEEETHPRPMYTEIAPEKTADSAEDDATSPSSTSTDGNNNNEGQSSPPLETRQVGEDEVDAEGTITKTFHDRMEQIFVEGQRIITFNSDGRREYMHLADDADGIVKTVVHEDNRMTVYYQDGRVLEEMIEE